MSKKLGLYIDETSVNWTLIDQKTSALIDMGVYVFPAGCENFGFGRREQSKRSRRRLLRLRRIRYARIRARKFYLMREMAKHHMCPISLEELMLWKQNKIFPTVTLSAWLAMNPYQLRAKGLEEKLSLEELGRIFYQISRHRGYRFGERNSKLVDNVLSKGEPREGRIGYYKTRNQLKGLTLGTYLYSIHPAENQSYIENRERIRNRICTVDMYFKEVHQASNAQEAMEHFCERKPSLLISDIKMQQTCGIELVQNIRKLDKDFPIIILSSHSNQDDLLEFSEHLLRKF